jgi:hypothetical protein
MLDKAFFYAGGEDALMLLHDEESQRYAKVNEFVERESNANVAK